ncbi:thiamine phosphate synthase [Jatrophihabitans telluris]|uniref:Thiamine-phosphate synthase n=1 Tax=Jatrophihabitans telluris TaxID=2038343 RepID=A0ABY4QXI9_9ACTN|nr:thiamine phosphate synthase [Jatrophihabitans telluris]UQX88079.1 thiamine phosphate synthase [Jatrophihabitans telluris]
MGNEALDRALLYLCVGSRSAEDDLPEFLDEVLGAGVDIVQLREKNLEAADELALLEVFRAACERHGALLAVNDRADLALAAGADVLHLGQRDLLPAVARRILGPDVILGRSSHSLDQASEAALDPDLDYFCLGPIWPTPTKAGRPHTSLDPVRKLAADQPSRPWFGIGGVDESTLDEVLQAGATRVVVVRAITEAADPAAATARIKARLVAAQDGRGTS